MSTEEFNKCGQTKPSISYGRQGVDHRTNFDMGMTGPTTSRRAEKNVISMMSRPHGVLKPIILI